MWRGWIRRSFLIFFPGTIAGKNISCLKDGSFLDVSDGQLRELSALKNGLQISDRELKKGKTQVPAYRAMYLDSQLKGGDLIKVEKDNAFRALIRNMQTMEEHKFQIPREQGKNPPGLSERGLLLDQNSEA